MRAPLSSLLLPLLLATAAAQAAPPRVVSEKGEPYVLEFVFDQPMLTWGDSNDTPLRVTPDPGCRWWWSDDVTLNCGVAAPNVLAKATTYRLAIGRDVLWSQAGEAAPAQVREVVVSPPEFGVSVAWSQGRPQLTVYSGHGLTAAAVREVLDVSFNGRSIDYHLEPLPNSGDGTRLLLEPAP